MVTAWQRLHVRCRQRHRYGRAVGRVSCCDPEQPNRAKLFENATPRSNQTAGNGSLPTLFTAWARDLAAELEETWHHWGNSGTKLVHPLAVHTLPGVIEEWNHKELLEFRL